MTEHCKKSARNADILREYDEVLAAELSPDGNIEIAGTKLPSKLVMATIDKIYTERAPEAIARAARWEKELTIIEDIVGSASVELKAELEIPEDTQRRIETESRQSMEEIQLEEATAVVIKGRMFNDNVVVALLGLIFKSLRNNSEIPLAVRQYLKQYKNYVEEEDVGNPIDDPVAYRRMFVIDSPEASFEDWLTETIENADGELQPLGEWKDAVRLKCAIENYIYKKLFAARAID